MNSSYPTILVSLFSLSVLACGPAPEPSVDEAGDAVSRAAAAKRGWDAEIVAQRFPGALTEGELSKATIAVRNIGKVTWPAGEIVLRSVSKPTLHFSTTELGIDVAPGDTFTFGMEIQPAPVDADQGIEFGFRLQQTSAPAFDFGPTISGVMKISDAPATTCADWSATVPVNGEHCESSLSFDECWAKSGAVDVALTAQGAQWQVSLDGQDFGTVDAQSQGTGTITIELSAWELPSCGNMWDPSSGWGTVTIELDLTTGALDYAESCFESPGPGTFLSAYSAGTTSMTCAE